MSSFAPPLRWSIGVTTVPSRIGSLLPATLRSLAKAGFPAPTLYVDGDGLLGALNGLYSFSVVRSSPVGHLGNWIAALIGVYTSAPLSDRFALFEDDLEAVEGLREYLETVPYPEKGYLNLLTHDHNLTLTNGEEGWHPSDQRGRGAVGLVFDRRTLRDLLSSMEFVDRPYKAALHNGIACADGMVLESLKKAGYTEYIHCPSLLQHLGIVSTMPKHMYGTVAGYRTGYNPMLSVHNKQLAGYT